MFRFVLFSALLTVACAGPISDESVTLTIVGGVEEFRATHPGVDLIKMQKVEHYDQQNSKWTWGKRQEGAWNRFTKIIKLNNIGNHVTISGDRLIASESAEHELPGDLFHQWECPAPGGAVGPTVHYITVSLRVRQWHQPHQEQLFQYSLHIFQPKVEGDVYLISGGVGHKNFTMLAEARHTQYFEFDGKAWGHWKHHSKFSVQLFANDFGSEFMEQ